MELEHSNLNMQQNLDDVEQCERRHCLRINGVTVRNNESASSTLDDVKTMFDKAGIDVPDGLVDRANWIGQGHTDSKAKQKRKSIIIFFTTFRQHRILVYRANKNFKNE